jgi:hypothetical protein
LSIRTTGIWSKTHRNEVSTYSLSTHSESVDSNDVSRCRAYDFYCCECNMRRDVFTPVCINAYHARQAKALAGLGRRGPVGGRALVVYNEAHRSAFLTYVTTKHYRLPIVIITYKHHHHPSPSQPCKTSVSKPSSSPTNTIVSSTTSTTHQNSL